MLPGRFQQTRKIICWMKRIPRSLALTPIAVALLTGCASPIDGRPVAGPTDVDQAFFFAGDVPAYGQRVSDDDIARMAYLRAVRRIDVCGLLTGGALARVGETVSVGTLFAFNECDAEVKISGVSERRFVSVELDLASAEPSGCDVSVPLPLSRLPDAPPLPASAQPSARVGVIGVVDCELARRIGDALTARLEAKPLPPRDAAAIYPSRMAGRDACEVLSVRNDITDWDVHGSGPYRCRFSIRGDGHDVGLQLSLQPRVVDAGPAFCSAVSFVDAPMQRKVLGVGYVDPADIVIRPAVVVEDVDGRDCATVEAVVTDVANRYR
jgi:hypothetical protein